ncbi:MAG: hypothetical protein F4Z58_02370 [Acidimicrobiaceae bacterium]|nr:hypothetical protein [Acidimicrobiaceae bacterium]MYI58979.1 hypothetical protein [Acidimicrobiaceae bacterium]
MDSRDPPNAKGTRTYTFVTTAATQIVTTTTADATNQMNPPAIAQFGAISGWTTSTDEAV